MCDMKIILASTSPRRQEVLKSSGLKFKVVPSDFEEKIVKGVSVENLVKQLARGKVESVARRYPRAIVVGADTMVVYKHRVYGKPKNKADAFKILKRFSGKRVKVISGVAVAYLQKSKKIYTDVDVAFVQFKKLSVAEIIGYVKSSQPMDKSGAFGIQGWGLFLIAKLDGNYSTIMGLPLLKMTKILQKFGINIF